jgi:hypothetical protein
MEIFIIFTLIFAVSILVAFQSKSLKLKRKSKVIKKQNIIENYKKQLDSLNNKDQKIKTLKIINQELGRNIFFDKNEIPQIMKDLTNHIIDFLQN